MDNSIDSTIAIVSKIIEDITGIQGSDIKADSTFLDDLELSSLEILSVVGEIESRFSVKISEKDLASIRTVRELAEVINNNQ